MIDPNYMYIFVEIHDKLAYLQAIITTHSFNFDTRSPLIIIIHTKLIIIKNEEKEP
jgi:hypothetical protein